MPSKKHLLHIAATASVFAAGALISDFSVKKGVHKKASPAELILGISGLVISSSLFAYAYLSREEEEPEYEDMLNDEDIALMDSNIAEVLGSSVEQTEKPLALRDVEIDDEATIEDFI